MVSRHCFVRVLDAIILPTGHSLFQLPELLFRLTESQARAFLPVAQHTGNDRSADYGRSR
jgi:hypothetical protein